MAVIVTDLAINETSDVPIREGIGESITRELANDEANERGIPKLLRTQRIDCSRKTESD